MTELERLEMLVKHMIDKENRLINWIEKEVKVTNEIIKTTDNHNLKMNWIFYQKALKNVVKWLNKLERKDNV